MVKVLFVCHGNICRSPMAEYLFKDYVKKQNKESAFLIKSAATSGEEIGNSIYYHAKELLDRLGIDSRNHRSRRINAQDFIDFDYIIVMDQNNLNNINRYLSIDNQYKVFKLLDFTKRGGSIADPWYTGNFTKTYQDIMEGIEGFYNYLKKNGEC